MAVAGGPAGDGVEAALVRVTGRKEKLRPNFLAGQTLAMPDDLHGRLHNASGHKPLSAGDLLELDEALGDLLARAGEQLLAESDAAAESIEAVACGGLELAGRRTGKPAGRGGMWSAIGSPARVAGRLNRPTVGHFHASDRSAGGCGAALDAWATWRVLRDRKLSRAAVHLGGVATLTFVPASAEPSDVVAFDIGPAGLLIDRSARHGFDRPLDADGALAARGEVCPELLHELLAHPFYHAGHPRSAGEHDWDGEVFQRVLYAADEQGCAGADLVATVTELVARSIRNAVLAMTERPHQVVLSGGGARNIHLAGRVRALLSPCSTITSQTFDIPPAYVRATGWALLAAARLDGHRAHCHLATGADRAAVLGAVYLP